MAGGLQVTPNERILLCFKRRPRARDCVLGLPVLIRLAESARLSDERHGREDRTLVPVPCSQALEHRHLRFRLVKTERVPPDIE